MSVYGLLFDQTKCIGCKACEQACQAEHEQPIHAAERLDQDSFNWVEDLGDGLAVRHFCMSCEDPTCVSVCPVAALEKTHFGPVTWDADACMGCRYCLMACPFSIPKYEWHSVVPRVRKCDMCVHRVAEGRPTACASICPTGATLFGRRTDLLREARRRLHENPDRYYDQVFGEHEAGGTAVLMLLARPPEEVGLPAGIPQSPMPGLTWGVLDKLPRIIPVWAVFLGGVYWLTGRKNEVAERENSQGPEDHDES